MIFLEVPFEIPKMLRFLTFLGACSCLSLFFMCDDNHHLYAGGNKNFNEISGIKGNWITNPTYENIDGFNPELFGTCSNDGNRECKCSPQGYYLNDCFSFSVRGRVKLSNREN